MPNKKSKKNTPSDKTYISQGRLAKNKARRKATALNRLKNKERHMKQRAEEEKLTRADIKWAKKRSRKCGKLK